MDGVTQLPRINEAQIIEQFRAAMRSYDIHVEGEIIADGQLHVAYSEGDKGRKKRAWYVLHLDFPPSGAFGHYSKLGTNKGIKWTAERESRPLSREERRALAETARSNRLKREAAERARHEQVAQQAAAIWEAAAPAEAHPYLVQKGVKAHGLRVAPVYERHIVDHTTGEIVRTLRAENALLIPMRDLGKKVWSLQAIFPDANNDFERSKDFLLGGRKRGMFHTIGKPVDKTICFFEGYATGASVHEVTGHAAVICFDAGNLPVVVAAFRERFPDYRFVIGADNDQWTLRPMPNPGVHHAKQAGKASNAVLAIPRFTAEQIADWRDRHRKGADEGPTDFNDLLELAGPDAVARQFADTIDPTAATPDVALATTDATAEYSPNNAPAPTPAPEPATEPEPPDEDEEDQSGPATGYFTILGYDHDRYYVFQHERKQITVMTKGDLTETGLITLAPIQWWEREFPSDKGLNKKAAVNWFVRTAHAQGIYDPSRLRGRGAWVDAGRIVFHFGNVLWVDGKPTDVTKIESRYTYELERSLPNPYVEPLTAEEGGHLLEIAEMFRWTKPASAPLLAGWVALAPLCGALRWRPHIWLTGGAGSGKTTVLNEYVHALLNGMDVYAQGNSTEAGIRQTLRSDALPVLFDESESNEESDRKRIQGVLALIRQASSESAARTLKGTAGGDAMHFHIRSMFALASIQVGMKYQADWERLTVLALRPKRDDGSEEEKQRNAEEWRQIKEALYGIGRDEKLPARLFRRSLDLLPVTLKNIDIFAEVAGLKFGSQRDGDQYGTLMAGAWSLTHDGIATPEEARAWLDQYDWSEYLENADTEESVKALSALLEAQIRLGGGVTVNVYELVKRASGADVPALAIDVEQADAALQRHGMKIRGDRLLLSNNSQELRRLVAGTPYEADLRGQLLRVKGADRYNNRTQKFNGIDSKCISLPLSEILEEDDGSVLF